MGDRAYTRFSIPLPLLASEKREHLAQIFGLNTPYITAICAIPPLAAPAGYDNGIIPRLVGGCPCLVIERDDWNRAGASEESELENAGIPYLRHNDPGREYGASQTASNASGDAVEIRLDSSEIPVVAVIIAADGSVTVDPDELADVTRFAALCGTLLTPPEPIRSPA